MAKAPQKPEDIFEEYEIDVKELFGDDLVSLILFGSAARGEYIPKKSDINFLIILTDDGIERFYSAQALVKKWRKRSVSIPLFFTENYIRNSLDSFPIEFLNISNYYQVLCGKDVFEQIDISRDDLRLQVEREMKGKLLNLRQAYFQGAGNAKSAALLIQQSLGTFLSLFPAILKLKDVEISSDSLGNIARIAQTFNLDLELLKRLHRIRTGQEKLKKTDSDELLQQYISQIRSLALQTDAL
jgi:predicted nucleotidyltransferase